MDRSGLAYLQDLFLLMVATVAVSMLLVNLSSIYMARQEQALQKELDAEAGRICDAALSYPKHLHDGRRALLDRVALDKLESGDLVSDMRIGGGFSVMIATTADPDDAPQVTWAWSGGLLPRDRGSCVASCAIWFGEGDVRPARVTVWIWRA